MSKSEGSPSTPVSEALKPCPFCGGTKIDVYEGLRSAACDACGASAKLKVWQSRAPESEMRSSDDKAKRIETAYCAANDYINALLNPAVSEEKRMEFATSYWQRVREV